MSIEARVLSVLASASKMRCASEGNTPVSASALITSAGQPMRARCGSARVCATRRLHMLNQFRSVHAAAMPCAERFALAGTPA
ncbi:hypothetical protein JHV675_48670 [Mycobacterium avium subsp. hominissuis]